MPLQLHHPSDQPFTVPSEHAETYPVLKGEFAGLRKMRVGDYRVIFTIMDNDILILRIGRRPESYKK
jgi:mRNA interferase RelE/StbE